jgi:molybdenum cofactor cytidylyltransferase
MKQSPVGILLAAGKSERFGSNKLLYSLNNDKPMLLCTAERLVSVLPESVAVINTQLESHASELERIGMQVIVNKASERGMGNSIACGVRASPDAAGWLVTLADMPYVQAATIRQLANALLEGAQIVAPFFQLQRGHPVGFQQRFYNDLASLDGDRGARQIIENNLAVLKKVSTGDEGVIIDIDHMQDLQMRIDR